MRVKEIEDILEMVGLCPTLRLILFLFGERNRRGRW